jgi:hypothetical protein
MFLIALRQHKSPLVFVVELFEVHLVAPCLVLDLAPEFADSPLLQSRLLFVRWSHRFLLLFQVFGFTVVKFNQNARALFESFQSLLPYGKLMRQRMQADRRSTREPKVI